MGEIIRFAPSIHADLPRPTARYRADRLYVPLEQSPPPLESWGKSILGGFLLVAFMVVGTAIAWSL